MRFISLSIKRTLNWLLLYRGVLLGCAVAAVALVALRQFFFYVFWDYNGLLDSVKLSDVLILTAGGFEHWIAFALVPVSAFGVLLTTKYDYMSNWVIRKKGYVGVWLSLALRAFGLALFLTLVITIASLLFGLLWTDGLVDFESKHGLFTFMTDGETMLNPPFILIVAAFSICCLMVLFLANSLWILVSLISKNKWIPMLFLIATSFLNELKIPLVFNQGVQTLALVNIDYQFWLFGRYYVFLLAVVVALVLQLTNLVLIKRSDYLQA